MSGTPDALVDFHTGEYLRAGWPIFIEEDLSPSSLVKLVPRFLATAVSALWKWPLFGHDAQLRRLFPDSPRLRALCSFEDLYVGLTPVEAPAVFSLLAAIELDDASLNPDAGRADVGVFYPLGGFGQFPKLLADAAKANGVEIRTDTPVDEVCFRVLHAIDATVSPYPTVSCTGAGRE